MKKMITALAFVATGFGSAASAGAVEDATARDVCNSNPVLAAEYLVTGELKVICPAGYLTGTAAAGGGLTGTGLTTGAVAGGLAALTVLVVVIGDDGTTTTTTTNTGG